jgi:hypothetical protein
LGHKLAPTSISRHRIGQSELHTHPLPMNRPVPH